MRVMAYLAVVVVLVGLWGLWLSRRKKLGTSRWFLFAATWLVVLPFLMNTVGWLLTESGRQPWIVQGILLTKNGLSPSVSTAELIISLTVFVLLYAALGSVDLLLMLRYARKELAPAPAGGPDSDKPDSDKTVPAMLY
jgi:cytochrome d ubiquinol oxidase subunit I